MYGVAVTKVVVFFIVTLTVLVYFMSGQQNTLAVQVK